MDRLENGDAGKTGEKTSPLPRSEQKESEYLEMNTDSKPVLYIQPIGCEGPGSIDQTRPASLPVEMCRPTLGHPLPPDPKAYSAIVCLGGPMGVYETDKHPWIENLVELLRQALDHRIPCLGICFGSQALAVAAGARVEPTGMKEIGWGSIHLTEAGKEDPLLERCPLEMEVFHWHGDRWELPPGADLLASSSRCDHQIFRLETNHYGFQCHLEILHDDPSCWANAYEDELRSSSDVPTPEEIRESTDRLYPVLEPVARNVFERFWVQALS